MRVTNILVRFERKRQPQQYESSGAVVELTGIIEEGSNENHIDVASKLLGDAKTLVLTELGLVAAGQSASAHVIAAANAAPATPGTPAVADKEAEKAAAKIAKAAAKAAEKAAKAPPPGGPGENRIGPEDVDSLGGGTTVTGAQTQAVNSNIDMGESAPVTKPAANGAGGPQLVATEILAYVGSLVKEGKLKAPEVKALTQKFGKERITELDAAKLPEYKKALDALIAASLVTAL